MLKAKEFFETAGLPENKWVEGETMVPHVAPASHFKSTMLYYPGTEELQKDEVRIIFMGSSPYPSQSQSGVSILVQLGNGENLVFDLGIGSLRNYNSLSIPFSTINRVFYRDGKVWWREGVAENSAQTPRPVFKSPTVRFPAPRHQVYDVINDTIEANEIPPEKWYPKGHKPELIREWPLTEDVEIPNPFATPRE